MTPEISVTYEYAPPKPVTMQIGDISFQVGGAFATFYRMFEFTGMLDEFLAEAKPYYWKYYQNALRMKQIDEDRKREMRESAAENLRIKQNAKKRERREKKNSVLGPENAVQPL